ncbi:hypothetical protein DLM75_20620 [Leptospira stimsonii]|uniref:Uncharacterized protein n=1 Tax=Leptospira stimsonii TaxID=2202203 RepID=A0A396YVZ2_9LEPT|nr:hypothetical protein DLM75_20620 [Leptospira stimsonii]
MDLFPSSNAFEINRNVYEESVFDFLRDQKPLFLSPPSGFIERFLNYNNRNLKTVRSNTVLFFELTHREFKE